MTQNGSKKEKLKTVNKKRNKIETKSEKGKEGAKTKIEQSHIRLLFFVMHKINTNHSVCPHVHPTIDRFIYTCTHIFVLSQINLLYYLGFQSYLKLNKNSFFFVSVSHRMTRLLLAFQPTFRRNGHISINDIFVSVTDSFRLKSGKQCNIINHPASRIRLN